jgi:hypothetical protein
MTDEQEGPFVRHAAEQLDGFPGLHVARKQGMELEELALGVGHLLERQFGRFACSRLGGGKDRAEGDSHARKGNARDARLVLAALGQLPLSVRTGTVRLCVGMTEQPELTSHCHGVLRA